MGSAVTLVGIVGGPTANVPDAALARVPVEPTPWAVTTNVYSVPPVRPSTVQE
jgi:hypothetical protein